MSLVLNGLDVSAPFLRRLVRFWLSRLRQHGQNRQRRRTLIDMMALSPHLLRDIGASEDHFSQRTGTCPTPWLR